MASRTTVVVPFEDGTTLFVRLSSRAKVDAALGETMAQVYRMARKIRDLEGTVENATRCLSDSTDPVIVKQSLAHLAEVLKQMNQVSSEGMKQVASMGELVER